MSAKKKKITIMIGIEAIIIAAVIIFLIYINSDTAKAKRQLELAQWYLSEEDYEQAVAAFEEILGIDPKNEEAYLGLAEAYAATDNLQGAVSTLEKASGRCGSEKVTTMLEVYTADMEQREQAAQRAAEAAAAASAPHPEDTAGQTPELESETVLTGFIVQDDVWYYYDAAGNYVTGWFEAEGGVYCADTDGRLYRDGEYEIDGKKQQFDALGVWLGEVEDDAWKQAYIDYLKGISVEEYPKCQFIYIDNDDIPEVALLGSCEAYGNIVLCYSGDGVYEEYMNGKYFSYKERQNLFCNSGGHMDANYDIVYSIIGGEITCIGEGNYGAEDNSADSELWSVTYYWNGNKVTEEGYGTEFGKIYDGQNAIDVYDEGISLEKAIDELESM